MFSRPRQRRQVISQQRDRQVVCVFGPPGSGVSTILRTLVECTRDDIDVVVPEFGELADQVQKSGARVVFVDGYPHCGLKPDNVTSAAGSAVQYLYDKRLVYPGSGKIVRVYAPAEAILRHRRASADGFRLFNERVSELERVVRLLMPGEYRAVHNEDGEDGLAVAVHSLAKHAGLIDADE